jgi:hypothetical protein
MGNGVFRFSLFIGAILILGCSEGFKAASSSSSSSSSLASSSSSHEDPDHIPSKACQIESFGHTTLQLLNREEYNNTLRDLLGISSRPGDAFPEDAFGETFNNSAEALTLSPQNLGLRIDAAETALAEAFSKNASRFMTCSQTTTTCARQILAAFAEKAFRRPVSENEVLSLMNFQAVAAAQGEDFKKGIQLGMQAALSSPQFLYRSIAAPEKGVKDLNDYELASRLSYFIWSSMPDDTLFSLAKKGSLKDPAVLSDQVRRMLADAKAQALIKNFATQWLDLSQLDKAQPDAALYPQYNSALKNDMKNETLLFLNEIFSKNLSPHQLLSADYSFVNSNLAALYGLSGVQGSTFQKVSLKGSGRQGLLTQAGILAMTSHSQYPSIVLRGKYVVKNLLCDPPPAPPPVLPTLPGNSEQERSASRLSDARCLACHSRMDPIGYGLQNFGALGQWRTTDENGKNIDGAGQLVSGERFKGPLELNQILNQDKRFDLCVSRKILSYALARDLKSSDSCSVEKLSRFTGKDKGINGLIEAVVLSDSFKKQSGENP